MAPPPPWLAGWVLALSLLAFVVYAFDKRAARTPGARRTPERTLHLIALAGGWPGALLAQRVLRHKNRKPAFQRVFWLTVVASLALGWVALRAQPSAASMSRASDSGLSVGA